MSAPPRLAWLAAAALAILVAGCSRSVKSVCEDLADACDEVKYGDCADDGEELRKKAETWGCSDTFEAYVDCVASAGCKWKEDCAAGRAALESCVLEFPD